MRLLAAEVVVVGLGIIAMLALIAVQLARIGDLLERIRRTRS